MRQKKIVLKGDFCMVCTLRFCFRLEETEARPPAHSPPTPKGILVPLKFHCGLYFVLGKFSTFLSVFCSRWIFYFFSRNNLAVLLGYANNNWLSPTPTPLQWWSRTRIFRVLTESCQPRQQNLAWTLKKKVNILTLQQSGVFSHLSFLSIPSVNDSEVII